MHCSNCQKELPIVFLRAERIIAEIEQKFGLPAGPLKRKGRTKTIVEAKKEAVRNLRMNGFSYPEIGNSLGIGHETAMWHFKIR